ncbi:cytochrome P450 [Nocardia sp. NPDC058499]|uniref:cytochrome P450 n=1 Tax=Nocardia sp. NPDC058499 TaxID=3346530 RepID=UPI003658CF02
MNLPPIVAGHPPPNLPGFLTTQRRRLGDVFAIEPADGAPTVYCLSSAAVAEMFAREREGAVEIHNTDVVHTLFQRAVFTLRGREHTAARTWLSTGLRHDAVASYLPTVAQIAHQHATGWTARSVVALDQAARDYTMDLCLAAILGLAADDAVAKRVPELFDLFVAGAELPPDDSDDEIFAAAVDAATELRELLRTHLVHVTEAAPPSVLSTLLASHQAPGPAMVDHLLALLIAARETTASLITWLLIECALDDQLADAVRGEAHAVLTDPVQVIDRGGAPLLRRVLTECTRLHTPNTVATRHAVTDTRIGGYTVPVGWHVAYSAPATHQLPELFTDPHTFDPQRFCGPAGARRAGGLLAFGRGAHACAGRGFAEASTLLMAAAAFAGHRITLAAPQRPRVARFQPVRTPAGPVHATVTAVSR